MNDFEHRLRAAMHDAVDGAQPPPNLAELVKRRNRRHRARVAVPPPPGPQRLARARARFLPAIAQGQGPAGRAARSRPRRATRAKPGRRWPGWVPPLAAAAAVAAVIAGTLTVSSALRHPAVTAADGAIAYVFYQSSATVTPIRTATGTALPPIKLGRCAYASAPERPPKSTTIRGRG